MSGAQNDRLVCAHTHTQLLPLTEAPYPLSEASVVINVVVGLGKMNESSERYLSHHVQSAIVSGEREYFLLFGNRVILLFEGSDSATVRRALQMMRKLEVLADVLLRAKYIFVPLVFLIVVSALASFSFCRCSPSVSFCVPNYSKVFSVLEWDFAGLF